VGGGTKAKEDFAQNRASKIKLGAIRGATEETAHFGALLYFRPFSNTVVLVRFATCTRSRQENIFI